MMGVRGRGNSCHESYGGLPLRGARERGRERKGGGGAWATRAREVGAVGVLRERHRHLAAVQGSGLATSQGTLDIQLAISQGLLDLPARHFAAVLGLESGTTNTLEPDPETKSLTLNLDSY